MPAVTRWLPVLLLAATPALAQTPGAVTWTTFLRAGPGTQYAVRDEIASQAPVVVQGCADGWCRVLFGGVPGYVASNLVSTTAPAPLPRGTTDCFDSQRAGYQRGEAFRYCAAAPAQP